MFDKVAIVGPGLIGGSMGMALRKRGLAGTVVGIGRRQESLNKALEVGAIDQATLDVEQGVTDADLVVLATPIGTFEELTVRIAEFLRPESLLTDVASSKARVVATITAALRRRPDVAYIPSHPMAGSEQSGPLAASADLFEGCICIITPLTNTFPESKSQIVSMWQALGARVVSVSPQAHDRTVARISHLPHLAAAALVAALDDADMKLCGKGLLDTTRVASASTDLWMDICETNRDQVHEALKAYIALLQELATSLEGGDLGQLRSMLETAKDRRDRLVGDRQEHRTP
ncbi:MAG: prephenate dehydrogenase/arogenate dehydrogenase family protein [Candidatus Brocadiae bacterium]|nr:prephenate dehydrogenase/arogenate dehydrogenase family protein [Candidatus Brocadiia bacterium]